MEETKTVQTVQGKYVKARGWVSNPPLDCVNPHFKNRYASLKATLEEVNKACRMSDIAYVQSLEPNGDAFVLRSYVVDEDGAVMALSSFPVANVPNPQNFGSEMTYKKRQQAQADWGIVGEEDDDGEAAAKPYRGGEKTKPAPKADKPANDRLSAVRGLYKQALAVGIKAEGIEAHLNAQYGKSLGEMATLDDAQLAAFAAYLDGRIADMAALKGEAA